MPIDGDRITLRDQLREGDKERCFHWMNLEDWKYYDEPDVPFEPPSRAEFEARWRRFEKKKPLSHSRGWQIDLQDGRHIGWVNYYHLDEEAQRAYVGICLPEPQFWNQGYGTEAVRRLVDHLFAVMGLQEVRTATWTGNQRMMRCAQKSGFREIERTPHRAAVSVRGEPLERVEFGLSRAGWQAQHDADRPAAAASRAIRRMPASELDLIAAIDRSEDLEHEYLCTPTRDGLGLRLVRQVVNPSRPVPTWSPGDLELRLAAWHQKLQDGALLWGGFQDGALAGFVLLQLRPTQALGTIDSLCVDIRHRGRGLGAALLHQAESHCHESGCSALILSTGYSAPAVDFCLRHGFRIVGIQDPRFAPRGAALTLAKKLQGERAKGNRRQPPASSRPWEANS